MLSGFIVLSESRFHVYLRAPVLAGREARVCGQGVVGKNGVVVRKAGAGCVLAGWRILLERCRQVQVLGGKRITEILVKKQVDI